MGIGFKLDMLMKEKGTNANELAQKIGIPPTTIYSMIKRDSKKADIEVLVKIARELGVDTEYFCGERENTSKAEEKPYLDVELLIARNSKEFSTEQKLKLIKLLSEID